MAFAFGRFQHQQQKTDAALALGCCKSQKDPIKKYKHPIKTCKNST